MVYHCIHVLHLVSDLGLNFMGWILSYPIQSILNISTCFNMFQHVSATFSSAKHGGLVVIFVATNGGRWSCCLWPWPMSLATQAHGENPWTTYGFRLGHGFNRYVAVYQRVFYRVCPAGWWFGTLLLWLSVSYMGCHPSHWLIFFRGVAQPPTSQDCERSRIYRCCSSEKSNILQ